MAMVATFDIRRPTTVVRHSTADSRLLKAVVLAVTLLSLRIFADDAVSPVFTFDARYKSSDITPDAWVSYEAEMATAYRMNGSRVTVLSATMPMRRPTRTATGGRTLKNTMPVRARLLWRIILRQLQQAAGMLSIRGLNRQPLADGTWWKCGGCRGFS